MNAEENTGADKKPDEIVNMREGVDFVADSCGEAEEEKASAPEPRLSPCMEREPCLDDVEAAVETKKASARPKRAVKTTAKPASPKRQTRGRKAKGVEDECETGEEVRDSVIKLEAETTGSSNGAATVPKRRGRKPAPLKDAQKEKSSVEDEIQAGDHLMQEPTALNSPPENTRETPSSRLSGVKRLVTESPQELQKNEKVTRNSNGTTPQTAVRTPVQDTSIKSVGSRVKTPAKVVVLSGEIFRLDTLFMHLFLNFHEKKFPCLRHPYSHRPDLTSFVSRGGRNAGGRGGPGVQPSPRYTTGDTMPYL